MMMMMMMMMKKIQIKLFNHKLIKVINIFTIHSNKILFFLIENNQLTINDKQPRSPAIAIIHSNNRAPPQVEPFFRPKHLPVPTQQQHHLSQSLTNDFVSHSLPVNSDVPLTTKPIVTNTNEKKKSSQASNEHPEEPRTPHSRAKNVARFYPVTKDAPVVKPDVNV
jgi:hypothetical protein